MYVRMSTSEGVTDVDAVASRLQDLALGGLEEQKGFRGITACADRASGVVSVLTSWETEEDLTASDMKATDVTQRVFAGAAGRLGEFQVYEQLAQDIGDKPPVAGCRLVMTPITMAPADVDDNIAYFRTKVLPYLKASRGFRAVRHLIDRQTGQGAVGTVWDDESCLDEWMSRAAQLRAQGGTAGIGFGEPFRLEIILSDVR
jgi:heme-degrading monooxygenase HmoA